MVKGCLRIYISKHLGILFLFSNKGFNLFKFCKFSSFFFFDLHSLLHMSCSIFVDVLLSLILFVLCLSGSQHVSQLHVVHS